MFELLDRPARRDAGLHSAPIDDSRAARTRPTLVPISAPASSSTFVPGTPDVLAAMLDEVDYPMLLVARDMTQLHANKSARRWMLAIDPPLVSAGGLRLPCHSDQASLSRAVDAACSRGRRALVQLGGKADAPCAVAVVPLRHGGAGTALLMFSKPALCEALSIHGYARENSLTATEVRVLDALCAGHSPQAIAKAHGVALSTVRSQVGSLRAKTGAKDIGELVRRVAFLPPIVGALQLAHGHMF